MKPSRKLEKAHTNLVLEHCNVGLQLDKANARIAELTAEVAMSREQNDALSRISARAHTVLKDTPRACFSMYTKNMRETRSFGDQCDEIVDMVIAMNDIARNALKEGGVMNDDSEVRWLLAKEFHPNTNVVTHADYRALEERHRDVCIERDMWREELSELKRQYEQVRQCCMDETVRATRLMGDLEAMRTLVEGSLCAVCDEPNDYDTTSRVCRRCQDVDTTRTPKEQTK